MCELNTVGVGITFIRYFYASPDKQASPRELIRNYQNAIQSINGTAVHERLPRDSDGGETTLKVNTGGIDARRVLAAGFGEERPIADNRSEAGPARRIAGGHW